MQNTNELTLTLATHSAINVLHIYHTSSTYNTRKVGNVNKKIHMNIPAPKYNWAIQWNSIIIKKKVANLKTQSGPYDSDDVLVIITAF